MNHYSCYGRSEYSEACRLHLAIINEDWDRVESFIKAGDNVNADVKYIGYLDLSPLMLALGYNGGFGIIRKLVERGALVDYRTEEGGTALFSALSNNRGLDVIKYLIEKGASVTENDCQGETSLFYAARECGYPEVIDLLIDAGADVNEKSPFGNLPLHEAVACNSSLEIIEVFLRKTSDCYAKNEYGETVFDIANHKQSVIRLFENIIPKRFPDERLP